MPNLTLATVKDIPAVRQILILVGLAGAIALGLWVFFWSQTPGYAPLYSNLDSKDAAAAADALRNTGIPFKLDPVDGSITVPADQLHDARLRLAAQGLPGGSRSGMEMIEGEQGFGVSQFVEGARYQHALETELSRTISSLRPVKAARVHLAMPKVSVFTRQREPASASVLLELHSGRNLEPNQVSAIVHLVASSIPDLSSERIAIIDQSGRLLSEQDSQSEAAITARQFDQTRRIETSMVQRIHDLLLPFAGPGRVSAQVAVDMDFAQTQEAREIYNADPAKIRSEQISEQTAGGADAGPQGVPGAVANTPPGAPDPNVAAADGNAPSSRSATRNFELDRTLVHTTQPGGKVRRVTVAVLVDNLPVAPGSTPAPAEGEEPAGPAPTSRALTEDELARVEALVKEAVGFDAERGDSVSVMNAPFVQPDLQAELPELPLWEQPWVMNAARLLIGGLLVLLLLFGVLRPALQQLVARPESDEYDEEQQAMLAAAHPEMQRQLPPGAQAVLAGAAQAALPPGSTQSNSYEEKLLAARAAASQDPRRVAQVVKGWVAADG
ncbi:MAG TPA: flagellar basal-body MS-ring/collar protein FliF [Arenimonas sp.]|nr:flagellar basal-body MS-ring/collar protein FliF [Arenimonas sp.]